MDKQVKKEMIENCYNCKNCFKSKRASYFCKFKLCNMGVRPYFPKKIPKDAKYNYGIRVCRFEPIEKKEGE